MKKLIDEFRHGWQGISQPSLLFSTGFAAGCLALSTIARWAMAQIRPDVFFVPYFPAVFFAAAVGTPPRVRTRERRADEHQEPGQDHDHSRPEVVRQSAEGERRPGEEPRDLGTHRRLAPLGRADA